MTNIFDLHQEFMENDPEYKEHYEALETEFAIASAIIRARTEAGLTQKELADLIGKPQSYIARLESGRHNPTVKTIIRVGEALGVKPVLSFEKKADRKPSSGSRIPTPNNT